MNKAANDGKRSSSYTQYIKPFENTRQNLTVIRFANVSEVKMINCQMVIGMRQYGVVEIKLTINLN